MKSNYNGDEDSKHAERLMFLAEVAYCADGEDQCFKNNNKREGTRLNVPTVPQQRKSVTQVYREMGRGYLCRSF